MSRFPVMFLFVFLGLACQSSTKPPAVPKAHPPEDVAVQPQSVDLQSFDYVWETIRDRHWDATLGGLDWDAVRAELRPKVVGAKNSSEVRDILNEMLGRLKQSHFAVFPGIEEEAGAGELAGTPGIETRAIGEHLYVSKVIPGSPAHIAGVKPGWELIGIDDTSVTEALANPSKHDSSGVPSVHGPTGEPVRIVFSDMKGREVSKTLMRVTTSARGTEESFGHLRFNVVYEAKDIAKDIALLRLGIFFGPKTLAKISADIRRFHDKRGLIIDLRGNPGGAIALAVGIGGWLVSEQGLNLGASVSRENTFTFILTPQAKPYTGRLAILIDKNSGSTSEIFAAGMRDSVGARVFGETSAGMVLSSLIEALPNGDRFQFASADFVTSKGERPEGKGVAPDTVVTWTRKDLQSGRDPVVDSATAWIRSQQKGTM